MRACTECTLPVTAAADDGTGRHRDGCPRQPDREAYLADKRRRMPRLVRHQEMLREGSTIEEIYTELPPSPS